VGLSVSASFAILTVAFFFGVAALVDSAFYSMDALMKGADDVASDRMDWARTHIALDNATINGTVVLVNLTNTGSTVLDVKGVSVLVNGTYVEHNITNATVEGKASDIWSPNEKLRLELNITASSSERILVATGNGVLQYGVIA
jgi:archaellum component FlaF (FlaF/FlaG flagellin family)